MSGDIPPDFEKQWDMADIALHTEVSDEKKLYANKSVLAVFSPYFRALFFHGFKEKNDSTASLKIKFVTMKEILKIIHQVDFNYSPKGLKQYEAPMLIDLYRVADIYDFPTVRKLCSDQMNERPSVEMAKAAMDLGLHDLLMNILQNLSRDQVVAFVCTEDTTFLFSKKDFLFFYEKIYEKSLPTRYCLLFIRPPFILGNLASFLMNPQFDLTRPWEKSNIAIFAEKWGGNYLYGNYESIDVVSRNFKAKVMPVNRVDQIKYMAELDVEYATMMEILSAIHHCNLDYSTERTLHPLLLYDMYRTADVNHLDIPMIREMCVAMLLKQKTVDAWEVMCRLFGVDLESPIYKSLSIFDRREWIHRKNSYLSYSSRRSVVVITPAEKDPLFNLRMVRNLLSDIADTPKFA